MIGFPSDGGLVGAGVTVPTTLALSAVWGCLNILATAVGQLEWTEVRGNLELPPSRLITRPQAERTRREWTMLVVSTLALFDVCYLLKVGGEDSEGVPMALWPLDPSIVQPLYTDLYRFIPPDEFMVGQSRVARDDLVILRRSPMPSIQEGMGGVLRIARVTFAAAIAAEGYASRYWQAGGSPNIYLTTDANIPDAVATQIGDRWREKRAQGPDYPPVLSGGLRADTTGADPTTESAVEARRELVADIGRYFGVPTRLLNAPTGDHETYHNSSAANQDLVRYSLQNYIDAIEDAISEELPGGRRMRMETDTLTDGTLFERAQAYQLLTGGKAVMSQDEVREELGLPPAESPDQLNPPAPTPAIAAPGGNANGG